MLQNVGRVEAATIPMRRKTEGHRNVRATSRTLNGRWAGRCEMADPLSRLGTVDPDESTKEAISDWHYGVTQGYCL